MKKFPDLMVPFRNMRDKAAAFQPPTDGDPTEVLPTLGHSLNEKQVSLDVERAIDIMLGANAVERDKMRQQYRLYLVKNLPPDAIDWTTIDWVQALPFKTNRS